MRNAFVKIGAIGFFTVVGFLGVPALAQAPIQIVDKGNGLLVHVNERVVMRYCYENVPFKPYVKEFRSPGGVNVLRDAPSDHLHHHALMFAVKVDGVSFWEESGKPGRQAHRSFSEVKAGAHPAGFKEQIDWINTADEELLLKESRSIEILNLDNLEASLLVWQSRFEAPPDKESVTLTGAHYHGLGMRFLKSMDAAGEFAYPGAPEAEVVRGDERLVRSTWCAYTAEADGKPVTIAMFDHPGNVRPVRWFTMGKPFAYLSATMNLWKEPIEVARDKPLVVRYAVALWDGRVDADKISEVYERWIALPPPE